MSGLPSLLSFLHITNVAVTAWLIANVIASYFLPAIMAYGRHHQDRWTILAVNLFLGWTVLGWIVALVWAATWVEPTLSTRRVPPGVRQEPTLGRDAVDIR